MHDSSKTSGLSDPKPIFPLTPDMVRRLLGTAETPVPRRPPDAADQDAGR